MKFKCLVFVILSIISDPVFARTRFSTSPFLLSKLSWVAGGYFATDIAQWGICKTCNISSPLSLVAVDYGCQALCAGITKGPDRILHELIKYTIAQKISSYANAGLDWLSLERQLRGQHQHVLATSVYFARPFLVHALVRIALDVLIDMYLEEVDEEDNF